MTEYRSNEYSAYDANGAMEEMMRWARVKTPDWKLNSWQVIPPDKKRSDWRVIALFTREETVKVEPSVTNVFVNSEAERDNFGRVREWKHWCISAGREITLKQNLCACGAGRVIPKKPAWTHYCATYNYYVPIHGDTCICGATRPRSI